LQRREREVEEEGFAAGNSADSGLSNRGSVATPRIVSGDYYDVLPFDDDSVGLCIADVAEQKECRRRVDVEFSGECSRLCFAFTIARRAVRKIG
jgi:hypothetical protein